MKELKIEVPEGYEIDKENSSFEKIVFKEKKYEVNCWEDLKHVTGVYINHNSLLDFAKGCLEPYNKNIFLNKKYAKSALALAQISQLLPYYDTNIDWTSGDNKYCIERIDNRIEIGTWAHRYFVLAFNTRYEAERFLKHNEQLVKDFYMI